MLFLLADLPSGAVWLFLPDAEKPGTGFHDQVFQTFVGHFTSEHLEPYGYHHFGASADSAVSAPSDCIMALGG